MSRLDGIIEKLEKIVYKLDKINQTLDRIIEIQAPVCHDMFVGRHERRAVSFFGKLLRRIRVVPFADIEEQIELALTDDEMNELSWLDLLLCGRHPRDLGGVTIWLAIEISAALDMGDVDRAQRRATLLRKAGIPAVAVIAGEIGDSFTEPNALRQRVAVVTNGHIAGWDEALAVLNEPA